MSATEFDNNFSTLVNPREDQPGVQALTTAFPPSRGTRQRNAVPDEQGNLSIAQTTLRSGLGSAVRQLGEVTQGLGTDIAYTVEVPSDNTSSGLVQRELANAGAILSRASAAPSGDPLLSESAFVVRVNKFSEVRDDQNNLVGLTSVYLQTNNEGEKVFAPSSTFPVQNFQLTVLPSGNVGVMEDAPQHRLELGPSPDDVEGDSVKAFGAKLGDYILLNDQETGDLCMLTCSNGQLLLDGNVVGPRHRRCPPPHHQKCYPCNPKRH